MKIALSATGPDLNSAVDPRFGRAQYFIIVDPESLEFEAVQNPNISAMGGAGIQSAQLVGNKGIEAVITGQVGPNAHMTLNTIGVKIYQAVSGTVSEAIAAFKDGKLTPVTSAGPSHVGMAGLGKGGGRGMGMGGGRGRFSSDPGLVGESGVPPSPAASPAKNDDLSTLKGEADKLSKQLEDINKRISNFEKKKE